MRSKNRPLDPSGLTIDYKGLGTISIEELAHGLWEDLQTLKDTYNVRFVRSPRLKMRVTDEHGEEIKVRRPGGGYVNYLRTHHFRPACKDYEL
jgi:hypothetical protein